MARPVTYCSVGGCTGRTAGLGYCGKHYARMRRTGSLSLSTETREDRYWARLPALLANEPEEWRPIPGLPGYLASPAGQIATAYHARGLRSKLGVLAQHLDSRGYSAVKIAGRMKAVHRLVAATFLGSCPAGLQVRHLDGSRTNSAIGNLAYGTPSENAADRVRHGTQPFSESHPLSKWSDADVEAAVSLYLTTPLTQREVADIYGTTQQTVSGWVKGQCLAGPGRFATSRATVISIKPEEGQ